MKIRKDIKLYEYFKVLFFAVAILINVITFYSCAGINFSILYLSIVAACAVILFTMFGTRITNKILNHLIILLFAVVVSYCTYFSTPKFSYREAQTVLKNELSEEYIDVRLLDTKTKRVKSININLFIDNIYKIELNYKENDFIYYFNPFTGVMYLLTIKSRG